LKNLYREEKIIDLKKQLKSNDPIIKMKEQTISKLENENENLVNLLLKNVYQNFMNITYIYIYILNTEIFIKYT